MNPKIFDVTQENFSDVVLAGSHHNYVVVDFWATWCEPCKQLVPLLEKLSTDFGYLLAKVNTEEEQELAQSYGVRSIPDVRIYKDGAVVEQFTGALSESELRQLFGRFMNAAPTEAEHAIEAIHQMAVDGELEQASAAYAQLLIDNPDNSEVKLAYAKLLMELGEQDQANTLLSEIKPDDELYPAARSVLAIGGFQQACQTVEACEGSALLYAEGACAVINSNPEAALEKFLELFKKDRSFNDDAARKAMITIFDLLGEHPMVRDYQRKLAVLMY